MVSILLLPRRWMERRNEESRGGFKSQGVDVLNQHLASKGPTSNRFQKKKLGAHRGGSIRRARKEREARGKQLEAGGDTPVKVWQKEGVDDKQVKLLLLYYGIDFILELNRRSHGGGYQIKYVHELSRCEKRKRPAASTKTHSTLSKVLLRSIVRHICGWPLFKWSPLTRSWDDRMLSLMDLPGTKADWHGLINLSI